MLIFTDNTDRFLNEQLKEQDQYKNEMLASVCHDLKTPLNSMMSML
jgi:K+-sensing histidine kinase KdpD